MLRKLAQSKSFDLLGVAIVVVCAFFSGYLFENLDMVTHWGGISSLVPFGIISAAASCISLMSDRLTARYSNLGNWLGLVAVITSGVVEYLLGNHAALLTYPVTFVIQGFAINKWLKSDKYKAAKPLTGVKGTLAIVAIISLSLVFSYWINSLGFASHNLLFYLTFVVFALSMISNVLNAMKLELQWKFWLVYNLLQVVRSLVMANYANVGKYIYYIVNSFSGLAFWKEPVKA